MSGGHKEMPAGVGRLVHREMRRLYKSKYGRAPRSTGRRGTEEVVVIDIDAPAVVARLLEWAEREAGV